MKKSMLERMKVWFVVVVFLITAVFSMTGLKLEVQAASDFVLTHSYTGTLSEGDAFDLPLQIKNLSSTDAISGIELDFSSSGIVGLLSGGTVYVASGVSASADGTANIGPIPMRFTGDGSSNIMSVKVTYTLGATPKSTTVSLFLNVEKQPTDPATPFDPKKYDPTIQAMLKGYDVVRAGSTETIHITVKNASTSLGAKNISYVSPSFAADSPFVYSKAVTAMPVATLNAGASTDIDISLDVSKFAVAGTQPFTFKITYYNSWDVEFTKEFTIYLKVSNNLSNTSFDVQLASDSFLATAGGTFTLPLEIINKGSLSGKDVKVSLSGLTADTFMLSSGTGRYDFYRINGGESKSMTYSLRAASAMKSGSYPLNFDISYTDEKGAAVTEKVQLWIPVAGNEGQMSILEVLDITPSTTNVKPGDSFSVTVKVKNSGSYDASQIKVSADGTTALMPVSQNLYIIQSLKKGETKDVIFKFQPQPEAARGSVPITIKVEPINGGENSSISRAISVFVDSTSTGTPDAGKNVPKIIVNSYSSEPTLVKAGEKFTLHMQFLNTHASKTVRNIKGNFVVTESSNETGSVFSPVDSSNTFYIDSINPRKTYDWTLTLYTIPDAKSKTYTVTVSFEYEDDAGNPYKADELIGIPVYQPSRFETSEISIPPETYMGQPVFVGFEMYNMGKTDIYNVKLNVEGDFTAQPKSNYFGNFESGRTEYFELNIIPSAVGQTTGKITFQYETASGEKQELVKEFSMNVMEMMMPNPGEIPVDGKPLPGAEGNDKGGSFFKSVWFYIILGVVVAGGIAAVILIKRKRKKKEEFDF